MRWRRRNLEEEFVVVDHADDIDEKLIGIRYNDAATRRLRAAIRAKTGKPPEPEEDPKRGWPWYRRWDLVP